MDLLRLFFILFLILTFLAGIYVILTPQRMIEKLSGGSESGSHESIGSDCPDLLVQKGDRLLLYNSKKPESATNPIPFYNLDEYIYYLAQQRKNGYDCPILYLQQENNAQGQDVYRIRPSPFDPQGGLPPITNLNQPAAAPVGPAAGPVTVKDASREHGPYNKNNYSGFDPTSQYVGVYTNIDVIHDTTKAVPMSDNPMDPNWGGVDVTNEAVESGKYSENNVVKPMLFQPKMAFLPVLNKDLGQPKDVY